MTHESIPFLEVIFLPSFRAGVLIAGLFLLRYFLSHRISPAIRHAFWGFVPIALLPMAIPSPVSVYNLLPQGEVVQKEVGSPGGDAGNQPEPRPEGRVTSVQFSDCNSDLAQPPGGQLSAFALPALATGNDGFEAALFPLLEVPLNNAPGSWEEETIVKGEEYSNLDVDRRLELAESHVQPNAGADDHTQPTGSRLPTTLFDGRLAALLTAALYLFGCLFMTCIFLRQILTCRRWIKTATPVRSERILSLFVACQKRMRINTWLVIAESPAVSGPFLIGTIRPTLLLPSGMVKSATDKQLQTVFLHEFAHLKRWDVWTGWAATLILILHWFNPMVWMAIRRMNADREEACDALALNTLDQSERGQYAHSLVDITECFAVPARGSFQLLAGLVGISETGKFLTRRIDMMRQIGTWKLRWTILALLTALLIGAVTLTDAQQEREQTADGSFTLTETEDSRPAVPVVVEAVVDNTQALLRRIEQRLNELDEEKRAMARSYEEMLQKERQQSLPQPVPATHVPFVTEHVISVTGNGFPSPMASGGHAVGVTGGSLPLSPMVSGMRGDMGFPSVPSVPMSALPISALAPGSFEGTYTALEKDEGGIVWTLDLIHLEGNTFRVFLRMNDSPYQKGIAELSGGKINFSELQYTPGEGSWENNKSIDAEINILGYVRGHFLLEWHRKSPNNVQFGNLVRLFERTGSLDERALLLKEVEKARRASATDGNNKSEPRQEGRGDNRDVPATFQVEHHMPALYDRLPDGSTDGNSPAADEQIFESYPVTGWEVKVDPGLIMLLLRQLGLDAAKVTFNPGTNSFFVLGTRGAQDRVKEIFEQFQKAPKTEDWDVIPIPADQKVVRTYVLPEGVDPSLVMPLISTLAPDAQTAMQRRRPSGLPLSVSNPSIDTIDRTFVLYGPKSDHLRVLDMLYKMNRAWVEAKTAEKIIRTFELSHVPVETMERHLSEQGDFLLGMEYKADRQTNSLIFQATKEQLYVVAALIEKYDVPIEKYNVPEEEINLNPLR